MTEDDTKDKDEDTSLDSSSNTVSIISSGDDDFDATTLIQDVNKYLVLAELEWFFLSKNNKGIK